MEIRYNVTGAKRKELVKVISDTTGARAEYKFMPTCNYEIDYFTVTKDGTLLFDDRADSEEVEQVLEAITAAGFECEAQDGEEQSSGEETKEAAEAADTAPQEANVGLTVEIPSDKVSVGVIGKIKKELFNDEEFYAVAGRQVNWKRFDIAVKACVKTVENLLIVGDGPEHASLVKLASDNPHIKFLPKYNGAEEIAKYFKAAKGLIFPSLEPFGIIPVEALACGLPILAYAKGGSVDIVEDGINGQFFTKQTVASLAKGIKSFNVAQYNRQQVAKTADRFNEAVFTTAWCELINQHCETSL